MEAVKVEIDGKEIDLSQCPPNKDSMGCFLTGEEVDQRATCSYCWLHTELESYHPDAGIGRLRGLTSL